MIPIAKRLFVVVSAYGGDGMRRRELLFGAVSAATGVGLLTGTRGVSQSESQRTARVAVDGDEDAYVGLEFTERISLDGSGTCTETVDILTITNQSKLELTDFQVSIRLSADAFEITDKTVPGTLSTGETGTVTVTIQSSGMESTVATVDLVANTNGDDPQEVFGAEGRFELHRSWEVSLEANCAVPGTAVSFIAFEPEDSDELHALSDITVESMAWNADGEVTLIDWRSERPVSESVVYGGREWYLCAGGQRGTAGTNEGETDCRKLGRDTCLGSKKPYRCPESPGRGERCAKFDVNSSRLVFDGYTKPECNNRCTDEEGN